jgi:phospholipid/cholesterol/gamma-HCH transport system substrate-binding protein
MRRAGGRRFLESRLPASHTLTRVLAAAALTAAVLVVGALLLGSRGGSYSVHARFQNASQLVKGNLVQVAGVPVGKIQSIDLTPDGQADVRLKITDAGYRPLRRGTKAIVRQASLSGVANRYIDLQLPAADHQETIPPGGVIDQSDTTTAVDLDQLFNTFDPKTRKALSGLIRGSAASYAGKGEEANAGWAYLNPSLAASSRLFKALDADTPALKRFIGQSSQLVGDLATRRSDLAGLVDHLATTTGAIGRQKQALSTAIGDLPGFMRRADTTFVNLRATLDDLEPLVDESKPVAKKLRPFLAELRPLAHDARPTLRDLSALVRSPGASNDLIELTKSSVPVRNAAVGPTNRNGKQRDGAFPGSTKALAAAIPELATARPYAPDLTGWFDDFGHSGLYDALGGASRAGPYVNLFAPVNGALKPLLDPLTQSDAFKNATSLDQRWRCPGSVERGATWKPSSDFPCDAAEGPLGP